MTKKRNQIEITGLWKKKDRNGNDFFVGSLNNNSIMIFKNDRKTKDTHPDYKLFLAENEREEKKQEPSDDDGFGF